MHPSARQTRGEVVALLRKHQSRYEPQWDKRDTKGNLRASCEQYLEESALQIAWGGTVELQAAADRWLVRINVLTERGPRGVFVRAALPEGHVKEGQGRRQGLVARVQRSSLRLVEAASRGDDALQGVAGIAASRRRQGAQCDDQRALLRTTTVVSCVDGQRWDEAQPTWGGP